MMDKKIKNAQHTPSCCFFIISQELKVKIILILRIESIAKSDVRTHQMY
ncbi:MAG: hypothetical protein ACTS8H_03500 [Arsenophonus sp. NC-PE1-MAG3]